MSSPFPGEVDLLKQMTKNLPCC